MQAAPSRTHNSRQCRPLGGFCGFGDQWYSGMRFKDIFERVKLSEIIPMYSVYHEMDISKFIETIKRDNPDC